MKSDIWKSEDMQKAVEEIEKMKEIYKFSADINISGKAIGMQEALNIIKKYRDKEGI